MSSDITQHIRNEWRDGERIVLAREQGRYLVSDVNTIYTLEDDCPLLTYNPDGMFDVLPEEGQGRCYQRGKDAEPHERLIELYREYAAIETHALRVTPVIMEDTNWFVPVLLQILVDDEGSPVTIQRHYLELAQSYGSVRFSVATDSYAPVIVRSGQGGAPLAIIMPCDPCHNNNWMMPAIRAVTAAYLQSAESGKADQS